MRTLTLRLDCPVEPDELWSLRADFSVEQEVAKSTGRTLELQWETIKNADLPGVELVSRKVKGHLSQEKVPGALRRLVKPADLAFDVLTTWCPTLWDENHPCVTTVVAVGGKIKITTTSWIPDKEEKGSGCVLRSDSDIQCSVFAVGGVVESIIEAEMREASKVYMKRMLDHAECVHAGHGEEEGAEGGVQAANPEELKPTGAAERPVWSEEVLLMADRSSGLIPIHPSLARWKKAAAKPIKPLVKGRWIRRCKIEASDADARVGQRRCWGCCGRRAAEMVSEEEEEEVIE